MSKEAFRAVVDEVDAELPKENKARVTRGEAQSLAALDRKQKSLAQVYKEQKKYPVRIAPGYAKYFGNIMRVVINGIAVAVKCDGGTYSVPASFAAEIERRMRAMDLYELKSRRMADFKNNYEPDIGHLSFF